MKATLRPILLSLSRVFARFHLWRLSACALAQAGPLSTLDKWSIGRLSYAMLMSSDSPAAHRLFLRLLRRNLDRSILATMALATMAQRLDRLALAALLYRRAGNLPGAPLQLAAAHSMARLLQGIVDRTLYTELAHLADRLEASSTDAAPLILVPVGSNYLDLFGLWIEQTRQHVSGTIVALALDSAAAQSLEQTFACRTLDLSRYFVFEPDGKIHPDSRHGLWILRVLVLRELVARGHHLLSLDLDAILLADLRPMLQTFPPADIVAQQDYSLPVDVARKLGFILCCGFMLFRPTPATIAFLDRYADRTIQERDDQLALNHLIFRSGVTGIVKVSNYMTFQSCGAHFLCPDTSLVSRDIGYGTVLRHFQQQGQTIAQLRSELGLTLP